LTSKFKGSDPVFDKVNVRLRTLFVGTTIENAVVDTSARGVWSEKFFVKVPPSTTLVVAVPDA
jgi:hypothetical protein